MRVLILGGGGREHALGWKLAQSPHLSELHFCPGNPGTESLGQNHPDDSAQNVMRLTEDLSIDLVVVGPEKYLVDGMADRLAEHGVACYGPSGSAARLEGSKAYAKEIMEQAGVPTASSAVFDDAGEALAYVKNQTFPLVVKADGLAAGKGVTICHSLSEAEQALKLAMTERKFGQAGDRVVIEEFLKGTEASFHVICDGERGLPLVSAQDHKALLNGNQGPNTGGMGTFAPSHLWSSTLQEHIQTHITHPVLKAMRTGGNPFRGTLFVGLMLTDDGPKVLEFNVRFGDPETQVMMPLLDFDLLPVLLQAANGSLETLSTPVKVGAAVCVVLAAEGYPEAPRKGDEIRGVQSANQLQTFHAGTGRDDQGRLVTKGGRVLGVTGWGSELGQVRQRVYGMAHAVSFQGKYFRDDIGAIDE